MTKTWIRVLYVVFSEYPEEIMSQHSITIGKTCDDSKRPRIEVTGEKFLSPLEDNFTIRIYNLTYKQLIQISEWNLYRVRIYAGYLGDGNMYDPEAKLLFDGGLVNMLNQKNEYKDNVAIFVCASKFIARAQKFRCSISFNAGLNMYSAIHYILARSGVSGLGISDSFKYQFFKDVSVADKTPADYLSKISSTDNSWFCNTDNVNGAALNFWNREQPVTMCWQIDPNKGMMIGSAPQITMNGLQLTSLPVASYATGDMIQIDNRWINATEGTDTLSGSTGVPNTTYLDSEGLYYIYSLNYTLSNTTGEFQVQLTCRAKQYYDNVTGGN